MIVDSKDPKMEHSSDSENDLKLRDGLIQWHRTRLENEFKQFSLDAAKYKIFDLKQPFDILVKRYKIMTEALESAKRDELSYFDTKVAIYQAHVDSWEVVSQDLDASSSDPCIVLLRRIFKLRTKQLPDLFA